MGDLELMESMSKLILTQGEYIDCVNKKVDLDKKAIELLTKRCDLAMSTIRDMLQWFKLNDEQLKDMSNRIKQLEDSSD